MTGVKETLCTSCVHREVCSKKEEFLAAQKAVDNLRIGATETNTGVYLSSIPWIRPIQLQCTYYMSNGYGTLRGITTVDYDYTTSDHAISGAITNKCGTGDNVFGHIVGGDTIAR